MKYENDKRSLGHNKNQTEREQVMEGKQGYNKNQKEREQVKEGKQY